jgi:hypothetical protein
VIGFLQECFLVLKEVQHGRATPRLRGEAVALSQTACPGFELVAVLFLLCVSHRRVGPSHRMRLSHPRGVLLSGL